MKVEGVSAVLASLDREKVNVVSQGRITVLVGFTQFYGIYVHENLESHHPVGQAKFLEQPTREHEGRIKEIIGITYRKTKSVLTALTMGGLFLQREAQLLTPVDTGALRASAFTRQETE